ncbi:putative disease resistance RPP13-like protein 1 [Eucalyptus grandis]|uniref:putative disease resistance RPP13-like protein 1 n=1 Tax=Eucalyptus grandis TaxID=71139 RepID=UPI00192EAFDF|nr:putative disease resistance RPP13-like protein 1 [Eucalyptus grandis]
MCGSKSDCHSREGGIGKTALAQQVYNDVRVTNYFEVKAWVCVSDEFDVLAITKRILEATDFPLSCDGKDLNWLQDKLNENLFGKKFLVVLDDVWNKKYGSWTILLKPLQWGAKGSKIIITTRNLNVAALTNVVRSCNYRVSNEGQMAAENSLQAHGLWLVRFWISRLWCERWLLGARTAVEHGVVRLLMWGVVAGEVGIGVGGGNFGGGVAEANQLEVGRA